MTNRFHTMAFCSFVSFLLLAACSSSSSSTIGANDAGADAIGTVPSADASLSDGAPTDSQAANAYDSGGECVYTSVPGTATITSITTAPDSNLDFICPNDGQVVEYTFTPGSDGGDSDAGTISDELFVLLYGDSEYDPPKSCLQGLGIVVGATFSATQQIVQAGDCGPEIVVNVDLSTCAAQCM